MKLFLTLACALVFLFPAWSQADEKPTADKLELSVGMSRTSQSLTHGVLVNYRSVPTLNVSYETAQGFASLQNGVGLWLAHDELFKAGVSVNYMMGRQEKADSRYVGMGDVAGSAMSYAWAEWQPVKDAVTLYGNVGNSWHSASGTLAQWGGNLGLSCGAKREWLCRCVALLGESALCSALLRCVDEPITHVWLQHVYRA